MEGMLPATTASRSTAVGLMSSAAGLLLATALLAGCGSDKTQSFKDDYKPVNDRLLALGTSVGQAVSDAANKPDLVLAGQFTEFAAQLRSLRGRVDDLDPPDDLKAQTQALSQGVTR